MTLDGNQVRQTLEDPNTHKLSRPEVLNSTNEQPHVSEPPNNSQANGNNPSGFQRSDSDFDSLSQSNSSSDDTEPPPLPPPRILIEGDTSGNDSTSHGGSFTSAATFRNTNRTPLGSLFNLHQPQTLESSSLKSTLTRSHNQSNNIHSNHTRPFSPFVPGQLGELPRATALALQDGATNSSLIDGIVRGGSPGYTLTSAESGTLIYQESSDVGMTPSSAEAGGKAPVDNREDRTREVDKDRGGREESDDISTDFVEVWDQFQDLQVSNEERSCESCLAHLTQLLKVATYIIFFLIILTSLVGTKASVLLLLTGIGNLQRQAANSSYRVTQMDQEALKRSRDQAVYITLAIMCLPFLLTFILNLFKAMFGRFKKPTLLATVWTLLLETCHSFGISLLLWKVLPELDAMRATIVMTTVGGAPSLLAVLFSSRAGRSIGAKAGRVTLDSFAFLMQLSAPIVFILTTMFVTSSDMESHLQWQLPLAVTLTSFQWWENFFNSDVTICSHKLLINKFKTALHESRVKLYLIVAPVKICLMFGFAFLLVEGDGALMTLGGAAEAFSGSESQNESDVMTTMLDGGVLGGGNETTNVGAQTAVQSSSYFSSYWYNGKVGVAVPVTLTIILPPAALYFSIVAARLKMQPFTFGLSLTLSTPISLAIVLGLTVRDSSLLAITGDGFFEWAVPTMAHRDEYMWPLILGLVLWWTSQMWINAHIWRPKNLRLAARERLFIVPFYCPLLLEQSLMYNRRKEEDTWQERMRVVKKEAASSGTSHEDLHLGTHTSHQGDIDGGSGGQANGAVPMIYCCATMWHENRTEMIQMLKSIFRLDEHQATMKNARTLLKETGNDYIENGDYYEFEAHIFFDDAMEMNDKSDFTLNDFVKTCVSTVAVAVSSMYNRPVALLPPVKIPTPYGGRLVWTMPGENLLVVHLKDKNKIRHRKRWSQIMYMYYLLGYRLMTDIDLEAMDSLRDTQSSRRLRKQKRKLHFGKSKMFDDLPEKTIAKAENTFIMALDGDVDFKPEAIQLLSDRLKRNKKVGVVCGRIHPIGSGPMVWYQKFEYAISHWLQKASEHVLGCVLCAPGCFSLFRGSALMDDNVMRKYATQATEARHYLQYDQGEDRWLSTLLLQQGYRVEYVAAADALTYAPETFKEFFNQRRRWGPSTMANIMDLLMSYKRTVKMNDNISLLYIFYQFFIFTSSLLGPATIVLMIAGAFDSTFDLTTEWSYFLAVLPPTVYIGVCFTTKPSTQLAVAPVLSALYSILMIAVLIGTIIQISARSIFSPSGIFLVGLGGIFIMSAVLHPQEMLDLVPGVLYYITIPTGYLLLIIYSMVNMNIVSWGTREVAVIHKPSPNKDGGDDDDEEQLLREKQDRNRGNFIHSLIENQLKENSLCGKLGKFFQQCCSRDRSMDGQDENRRLLNKIWSRLKRLNEQDPYDIYGSNYGANPGFRGRPVPTIGEENENQEDPAYESHYRQYYDNHWRDELVNPAWIEEPLLKRSETRFLEQREIDFWKKCIDKYLKPIDTDARFERKVADDLKSLRNNICFAFFMINALWIAMIFTIQVNSEKLQPIFITYNYLNGVGAEVVIEPVGFIFLSVFGITLILQAISMVFHRWGTLQHIMATTTLDFFRSRKDMTDIFSTSNILKEATKLTQELQRLDDEDDDDDDDDDENELVTNVEGFHFGDHTVKTASPVMGTRRDMGYPDIELSHRKPNGAMETVAREQEGVPSNESPERERHTSSTSVARVDRLAVPGPSHRLGRKGQVFSLRAKFERQLNRMNKKCDGPNGMDTSSGILGSIEGGSVRFSIGVGQGDRESSSGSDSEENSRREIKRRLSRRMRKLGTLRERRNAATLGRSARTPLSIKNMFGSAADSPV